MYADFKISTWERVEIPPELEEEFIQAVKDGKIETAEDCFRHLSSDDLKCDVLDDTSTVITPAMNEGADTMEVFNDSHEMIYNNVDKFKVF